MEKTEVEAVCSCAVVLKKAMRFFTNETQARRRLQTSYFCRRFRLLTTLTNRVIFCKFCFWPGLIWLRTMTTAIHRMIGVLLHGRCCIIRVFGSDEVPKNETATVSRMRFLAASSVRARRSVDGRTTGCAPQAWRRQCPSAFMRPRRGWRRREVSWRI